MFNLLRLASALVLGCSLGLSLVHAPAAHASGGPRGHGHGDGVHSSTAAPQPQHAADECPDCAPGKPDAPCENAHEMACATPIGCAVSLPESSGACRPDAMCPGAVHAPGMMAPASPGRGPDTPPPRG